MGLWLLVNKLSHDLGLNALVLFMKKFRVVFPSPETFLGLDRISLSTSVQPALYDLMS